MIWGKNLEDSEIHRRLLKYVRNNDVEGIERLVVLGRHKDFLNEEYSSFYKRHSILVIACHDDHHMENVSKSTITKLIKLGADCTRPTYEDWEPIHYAAINTNCGKLSAILDYLTREEVNSLVFCSFDDSYSNNALTILLKCGNRNKNFKECCDILIEKGINVYQTDSNGVTPLDLIKKAPELTGTMTKIEEKVSTGKRTLELIKFDNIEDFLSLHLTEEATNDTDGPTVKLSSCTILQLCCAKGLTSCVEHLLNSGANPNKVISKNKKSPILISIEKNQEGIVKLLLKCHNILLPEDILIKLQTKGVKIDNYMGLILKHLQKIDRDKLRNYLMVQDDINRTGLDHALLYRSSENILELLSLGAPLTRKNKFGFTPLHTIEVSLLEKFFDNCVNHIKDADPVHQRVEINYEALIVGSEEGESEFFRHLITLKKLTPLLNHPVVSTYLEVKWQKFKWAVFMNLFFYLVGYISLLFYGFSYENLTDVSNVFLLVSLILIVLRDLIRLLLFRVDYFKRVDSFVDLVLTGGIIYIYINNQNLRVAFSIVLLTFTLGIFLQLSNIPFFTVKVLILRQISITFFKYIIFYFFPVLAFFFCFYMLQEDPDITFFQTLYEITTMFAGDPDSSYPEQFTSNPIFGHIMYICFIVLIGTILQNLLIGLAVNDLREIKKEAEFIDKKERASYIASIERVLMSRRSWFFRKLLRVGNVFKTQYVLVFEPYSGCVYVKDNVKSKLYIKDQGIIKHEQYSLKTIYEKLEKIENILERLVVNK